jgi:hypothetical protein
MHDYQGEGDNIFLHCMLGVSRTATIAIAYLIMYGPDGLSQMDYEAAKSHYYTHRPVEENNLLDGSTTYKRAPFIAALQALGEHHSFDAAIEAQRAAAEIIIAAGAVMKSATDERDATVATALEAGAAAANSYC